MKHCFIVARCSTPKGKPHEKEKMNMKTMAKNDLMDYIRNQDIKVDRIVYEFCKVVFDCCNDGLVDLEKLIAMADERFNELTMDIVGAQLEIDSINELYDDSDCDFEKSELQEKRYLWAEAKRRYAKQRTAWGELSSVVYILK